VNALIQSVPHLLRGAVSTLGSRRRCSSSAACSGSPSVCCASCRGARGRRVGWAVELVRAVPLLLLLFFIFFGLPRCVRIPLPPPCSR